MNHGGGIGDEHVPACGALRQGRPRRISWDGSDLGDHPRGIGDLEKCQSNRHGSDGAPLNTRRQRGIGGDGEHDEFLGIPPQRRAGNVGDYPGGKRQGDVADQEASQGRRSQHNQGAQCAPGGLPPCPDQQHTEQRDTCHGEAHFPGWGDGLTVPDPAKSRH